MRIFILLLAADAAALLIAVYFFFVGIGDGSISSFNITLWLTVLAVLIGVPAAGYALRTRGELAKANLVLALVGVPTILAGLFVLTILISQPRWN
ncbi:MAG: hypothetical protein QM780_01945 [Hyphomicrobium sp.]|uniref:hypothetical protein n=1 Tax=Hyphomicrobium sp. TaxID=82 RepID=UPI0039E3BC02